MLPVILCLSHLGRLPCCGLRVFSPCCMCGMSSTTNLASSLHLRNLFELWFLLFSIHPEPAAVTKSIIHHSSCCFHAKLRFLYIKTTGPHPPCGKHHQEYQHLQTTAVGTLPLLSCHHWVRAEYQCTQARGQPLNLPWNTVEEFLIRHTDIKLNNLFLHSSFCNCTTILFPFQKYF